MSLKRKLENGILMGLSFCRLILLRLIGNRIHFSPVTLISLGVKLYTYGNGIIKIGKKVAVRGNTELSTTNGQIIVESGCFINRNCMIVAHDKIEIGERTTIGPNVCIYDHDHDGNGGYKTSPVLIGKNVWIGAGCIILKGVSIGDNTIIGAGSIVTNNIGEGKTLYQKRSNIIK